MYIYLQQYLVKKNQRVYAISDVKVWFKVPYDHQLQKSEIKY